MTYDYTLVRFQSKYIYIKKSSGKLFENVMKVLTILLPHYMIQQLMCDDIVFIIMLEGIRSYWALSCMETTPYFGM